MSKKARISFQMVALLAALICGSQYVSARSFTVSNNNVCPVADFTTIQAAVTAAMPGDTVNVCPGTYPEQVTINKNLTLQGIEVGSQKRVIVRPAALVINSPAVAGGRTRAAIILATSPAVGQIINVTVQNILVDGSGVTASNSIGGADDFAGIFYRNAGGSIIQNSVKNIRLNDASFGTQQGQAIQAFADNGNTTSYNVFIQENVVDNFQKTGVLVFGALGSDAPLGVFIFRNTINGVGPTSGIAQNGVQLSDKITTNSRITFNTISNVIYTGDTTTSSSGIILFQIATGLLVEGNNINRTDVGIEADGVSNSTFNANDISNTVKFEGIFITTDTFDGANTRSTNNRVTGNRIFNTTRNGIAALSDNTSITNNRINDADIGIAANGTTLTVTGNQINNTRQTLAVVSNTARPTRESMRGEGLTAKGIEIRTSSSERADR